jgi:hypothetical protein
MWWLPIMAFAQNKMQEQKAKEEAAKVQKSNLHTQLANSFGAPTYGAQAARSMYETQKQIDAQSAQNTQALMGSAFGKGGFANTSEAGPAAHGAFSEAPSPDEPDQPLTAEEVEELREAREALRGFR